MDVIKRINVLVDHEAWVLPYAKELVSLCTQMDFSTKLVRHQDELVECDVSFFIGCTQIVSVQNLNKSKLNLVVHESALPQGKGFAPVAWQILEGRQVIPICLIEASEAADSGKIWIQDSFNLTGRELYHQWRAKQGRATIELCSRFLKEYQTITPCEQKGVASFYQRRTPANSELAVDQTIADQFDLLRTVDNDNFPAFFRYRGKVFKLEITELDDNVSSSSEGKTWDSDRS